jgi:hypothetical protein
MAAMPPLAEVLALKGRHLATATLARIGDECNLWHVNLRVLDVGSLVSDSRIRKLVSSPDDSQLFPVMTRCQKGPGLAAEFVKVSLPLPVACRGIEYAIQFTKHKPAVNVAYFGSDGAPGLMARKIL